METSGHYFSGEAGRDRLMGPEQIRLRVVRRRVFSGRWGQSLETRNRRRSGGLE